MPSDLNRGVPYNGSPVDVASLSHGGSQPQLLLPVHGIQLLLCMPAAVVADDAGGAELTICDPRAPAWSQYLNSVHGSASAAQMLAEAAAAEAAAAAAVASRSNSLGGSQELSPDRAMGTPEGPSSRDSSPTLTLGQRHLPGSSPPTPDVRLYHRAVVAPMEPPLRYELGHPSACDAGSICIAEAEAPSCQFDAFVLHVTLNHSRSS